MHTYVATEVLFPLDGNLPSVGTSHPKIKQVCKLLVKSNRSDWQWVSLVGIRYLQ